MGTYQSTDPDKVCLREILTEVCEGITVRYTLFCERENGRKYYSIGVSAMPAHESVLVRDITGESAFAERIFDLVAEGKVTPVSASEVIEDLIETYL